MKNKKLKKLGNLKLRTKTVGAFIVIALMLIASITPVFAGTVTISSTGITVSDSDFTLDFDDDNMTTDNVSAGNVTVSGDFIGGNVANWDTAYGERGSQIAGENLTWSGSQLDSKYHNSTYIWNSNDNHYPPTEAGLQDAGNNLNNVSGSWVDGGGNNISQSKTFKVGTGEYRNFKLYLEDNSDVTMVMNYDTTNGNNDIHIHDVILDGNGAGQTADDSVGSFAGGLFTVPFGIYLVNCDRVEINSCNISDIQLGGIYVQQSEEPNIHHNRIYKIGDCFDGTNPADCYTACGIYIFNTTKGKVTDNHIVDMFSVGVIVESTLPSVNPYRCYYTLVDGNYVENTSCSFYCEDAENITFSNNIVNDVYLKDSSLFGGGFIPTGFFAKAGGNVNRLTYIGNRVTNVNTGQSGRAFNVHSNNTIIVGNSVYFAHRGIHFGGDNTTIGNNVIELVVNAGIYGDTAVECFAILGNIIHTITNLAMLISATADNFVIDNNICYGEIIDINAATSATRICPNTNIGTIVTS